MNAAVVQAFDAPPIYATFPGPTANPEHLITLWSEKEPATRLVFIP